MEYKVVDVKDWLKSLEFVIQDYANDGWELFQVEPATTKPGTICEWIVIFRRPKNA